MSTIKQQITAAEDKLGIESIYHDALTARNYLDKVLTELAELRDKKRLIETAIPDLEVQVIEQVWSSNADLAQVRLDKLVKNELIKHPKLREQRAQLMSVTSEIEGLEMDRAVHESTIKISTARMVELGGYLQWLSTLMEIQSKKDQ